MKKETIFKHELNESIQANAALNCLKNRNKPQQMNEALPLVAGAVRLAMPLLRPLITKLVKSLVMKAGAKLTGRQVAKMVIKNVANGKTIMKVGKKVGQTWTEIPAELKQEIAKTAVDTWKNMRAKKAEPQVAEQEETSEFDARFELRKDLKELASPAAKKAYMIIRKQYGDSMWRQLGMDDCDEQGLIDMLNLYAEDGLKPQQIVNKMMGVREDEETVDYAQLADDVCASYRGPLSKLDLKGRINYIVKMVAKKIGKTVDTLTPEELTAIQKAAKHSVWYVSEQEEDTLNAYYSQDEPDYENDHHGIWLIINLMRKMGMLRAQGIEGRDNVDDGNAIDKAYDLIEQKLNEEGMWIGDDDHEAERFVSFYGDEIAEEAMKSAIHNQKVNDMEGSRKEYYSQDEPDYEDDSHGIRLILNMLMKRGDITKNDAPRVQKQIKSMLDAEGMWIGDDESEAERFIEMIWDNQEQEEMPSMERHDMILALSEYMSESWIATDDGDLDDIYYAIADILDETGDYPASTDWEDCKPWCQKHYQEVEARIY